MTELTPDSVLVTACAPSPNHGERPGGAQIDSIILHYTGLREEALDAWNCDPGGEALRWMCNPQAEVSSHYLVELDGRIIQLVAEQRRAWHAGRGFWQGCRDINSCSIGIEIANTGHAGGLPPYPDVQIAAVIALCGDIIKRRGIRIERVLGHSDIAPDRKADPGEHFPWHKLAAAGVAFHVAEVAACDGNVIRTGEKGVRDAQGQLAQIGYGIEISGIHDDDSTRVVRAFQRRFRPSRVDGLLDVSTHLTLERVVQALARLV